MNKDLEKIEAAAQQYSNAEANTSELRDKNYHRGIADYGFRAGVEWRDQNPSPEVLALVDGLKLMIYQSRGIRSVNFPYELERLIAAYEESLKK